MVRVADVRWTETVIDEQLLVTITSIETFDVQATHTNYLHELPNPYEAKIRERSKRVIRLKKSRHMFRLKRPLRPVNKHLKPLEPHHDDQPINRTRPRWFDTLHSEQYQEEKIRTQKKCKCNRSIVKDLLHSTSSRFDQRGHQSFHRRLEADLARYSSRSQATQQSSLTDRLLNLRSMVQEIVRCRRDLRTISKKFTEQSDGKRKKEEIENHAKIRRTC